MEGSQGSKSESFTRALQKFTSLSSSNITITLPPVSVLQKAATDTANKPANSKTKTNKELEQPLQSKEKKFTTTSTQTTEEELRESAYSYDGHLLVLPPPHNHSGPHYYNSTSYSKESRLYSTLV